MFYDTQSTHILGKITRPDTSSLRSGTQSPRLNIKPCLERRSPRPLLHRAAVQTHARHLQCSAFRQMAVKPDTTTSLQSLTVDRISCLSVQCQRLKPIGPGTSLCL